MGDNCRPWPLHPSCIPLAIGVIKLAGRESIDRSTSDVHRLVLAFRIITNQMPGLAACCQCAIRDLSTICKIVRF